MPAIHWKGTRSEEQQGHQSEFAPLFVHGRDTSFNYRYFISGWRSVGLRRSPGLSNVVKLTASCSSFDINRTNRTIKPVVKLKFLVEPEVACSLRFCSLFHDRPFSPCTWERQRIITVTSLVNCLTLDYQSSCVTLFHPFRDVSYLRRNN